MPKIQFQGTVHPPAVNITNIDFKIDLKMTGDCPEIRLRIRVINSQVLIDCETPGPCSSSLLSRIGLSYVRAAINPIAFKQGIGLSAELETILFEGGETKKFFYKNDSLRQIGSFSVPVAELQQMMLSERELATALDELVEALRTPAVVAINCGRAIEGLRKIMVPIDPTRKIGWNEIQNKLNFSRGYREYITNASTQPRHGDRTELRPEVLQELLERSWTIMQRFIEYRRRGNQTLPIAEFRFLK